MTNPSDDQTSNAQGVMRRPSTEELLNEADNHYYTGDYLQAIELYNQILKQDPANARAREYVDKATMMSLFAEAEDEAGLPIEAKRAYLRARALMNVKDTKQAAELLKQAISAASAAGMKYPIAEVLLSSLQNEFIIIDDQRLTPHYLSTILSPYLVSIGNLQAIIDELYGHERGEVSIKLISQSSPISVSLDGAADAIQLVKETIVPWRRQHAETMARLLEQEKLAEIENKKADVLEKRARAERERVEITKQREEAERLKLENEKLRLALQRERIQLAIEVLIKSAPNIGETERVNFLVKLLPTLDNIAFASLEIITDT